MTTLEKPKLLSSGLTTCAGCLMELVARTALRVLGRNTVVLTPPSCSAILTGYGDETGLGVPGFQSNLENIAAYCSGIQTGFHVQGRDDIHILAFAGDGGTMDIGLQALSAAIERRHRFIYICYDNEAYMNTGIQRSGGTPLGAWTTTTPAGALVGKKNIVGMLLAQGIPYLATASAGHVKDLEKKVAKAAKIDGPSYLHVLTPCATGWRFPAKESVNVAKLAVESRVWPLLESVNGKLRLTKEIRKPRAVEEYFDCQGRFRNLDAATRHELAVSIDDNYNVLLQTQELQK